jgi:hypothetical protein
VPVVTRHTSNGEINRELTALKRAFSLAIQAGKLITKPHIPLLREDNVRAGFFEPEQYVSVLAHLPAHHRPVITFAYVTGWRIPERGPHAGMAADRFRRGRSAAQSRTNQESRGPSVSVHA